MKIFIIGAGFTGVQLAKRLSSEKNEVILIDNNEDTVRHAQNQIDCNVVCTDGNNLENLEELGIAKSDALVCVTENDEINMITCSMVDAVYPQILKIARVRNDAYHVNKDSARKKHAETFAGNHRPLYGIDYMIQPDREAADAVVKAVEHGGITDVLTFKDCPYELTRIKIEEGSRADGILVKDFRSLTEKKFVIVYIEDKEKGIIPSGETKITTDSFIGILSDREDAEEIMELCGAKMEKLHQITMVGAGKIGTIIADRLLEKQKKRGLSRLLKKNRRDWQFIIVDTDKKLCRAAEEKFPEAAVYQGDASDESFIKEEKLDESDLLICATHNHELNMVISSYYESIGVTKTIALVPNSNLSEIARKLGIDVPIPLRDVVVDSILSHLRGKSVKEIHTVSSGDFEIIECELPSSSRFNGKCLKEIAVPGEYLLLMIKKPGSLDYELPDGNTMLTSGSHLVLIIKTGSTKILEQFSGTL